MRIVIDTDTLDCRCGRRAATFAEAERGLEALRRLLEEEGAGVGLAGEEYAETREEG